MNMFGYRAFGVMALSLMTVGSVLALYRHHADTVWRVVHRQCASDASCSGEAMPFRAMDLAQDYALLQDRDGRAHVVLVPTRRIVGVESPLLQRRETPNYFWLAWRARGALSELLGKAVPDTAVAIVVNAQTAHLQNQLELHIACLRADIRQRLASVGAHWNPRWSGYWLQGHHYYLRTLSEEELIQHSPFIRLAEELPENPVKLERYGLALSRLQDGRFVLLALPRTLLGRGATLGATRELQDDTCTSAGTRSFSASWNSRVMWPGERSGVQW
ncbi:CDP-diacylglycerol diphosphatase [Xanthomonas albilineans]|uniref:CDP-diacylglycerol diphosphatase n=1 Tax=Xanthomonas albilineans TaxID=29447 RepID=UPI0005F344BC|nr:CDP-diacylglycerol diphosphatase [Xanthomonas albilineans]